MSDRVFDLRRWLLSVIVIMSVGFGVGVWHASLKCRSWDCSSESPKSTQLDDSSFTLHHLSLDMKNVDEDFLGSEERIQEAITNSAKALNLDLVSSGCHFSEENYTHSCLIVMEQGQASIQSWVKSGVITIDLIMNHKKSLIEATDILKEHFFIGGDDITTLWGIDLRGEPERRKIDDHIEMGSRLYIVKNHILSAKTKYHSIEIWETKSADDEISYEDALKLNLQPGDPRWLTNEHALTSKDIYVDGIFIFSPDDEEEELDIELDVQPFMFAHPNPKRVAVISESGDEGTALQQLLRHDIDTVTLFNQDEELIEIIKAVNPKIFDCSKIDDVPDDCFEDERVNWIKENATWFTRHYGDSKSETDVAFDVVLVDAVKPQWADSLSGIVGPIMKSLSSDGIFGFNFGNAPTVQHPDLSYGYFKSHEKLLRTLEALPDVEAIIVYDDDFTLNDDSAEVTTNAWFLACKSTRCRDEFYASPEVIDSKIAARLTRASNTNLSFFYYEGVVHQRLQTAPKAFETVYCRRDPVPFECKYRNLDFSREIFDYNEKEEESAFAIKIDETNPDSIQTTVFATVNIPKGSYIMASDVSKSRIIDSSALEAVNGGGEPSCTGSGTVVEIGASALIRTVASEEGANVGQWVPLHPDGKRPKYSPVYDNHGLSFDVFLVATKDIPKGGELLRYSRKQ